MKLGGFFIILLLSCTSAPTKELGLLNGEFYPCPKSPNGVSSMADPGKKNYIAPLMYNSSRDEALENLKSILNNYSRERVNIVTASDKYIHAEFTSKVLKLTNDVEIYLPYNKNYAHIRSISRMGLIDLGKNRDRVERIRTALLVDY